MLASLLMAGVLAFHGPLAADLDAQMSVIAAALSLFAVAGLIVLTGQSRLTENGWTTSAWAVLIVGALWTVTTAVVEVTVIADAAVAGNATIFETWWAFAEGRAGGFSFLALAIAVIAGNEARTAQRVTPVWASSIAVAAGVASFVGWALGIWLGIRFGNLLWVMSSFVLCLWGLWFGVALAQTAPTQDAGVGNE